jgi:hypothetical protein
MPRASKNVSVRASKVNAGATLAATGAIKSAGSYLKPKHNIDFLNHLIARHPYVEERLTLKKGKLSELICLEWVSSFNCHFVISKVNCSSSFCTAITQLEKLVIFKIRGAMLQWMRNVVMTDATCSAEITVEN